MGIDVIDNLKSDRENSDPKSGRIISKAKNRRRFIAIIILAVLNILLFALIPLDMRSVKERFEVALAAFVLSFPVVCYVLSLVLALIPYKAQGFGEKHWRLTLLILYISYIVFFVMMVAVLFLILFSYTAQTLRGVN